MCIRDRLLPEYSRGKIQAWIKGGHITIDGQTISSKKKIIGGENLIIEIQEEEELKQFRPEKIDIDIISPSIGKNISSSLPK